MGVEENKALFRRTIEEVNQGNYYKVWDLMTEDCEILDHTGAVKAKAEFRTDMDAFLHAYPDFHIEIEDLIAEGERVVGRYTESGTWKESFMGLEPTGQKVSYPAIEIWRFTDGKITGMWMARDILTSATQTHMILPME